MRVVTLAQVRSTMRLLEHRISRLTRRQLRKGLPVSYGVFDSRVPANTTLGRTPTPWTPGN